MIALMVNLCLAKNSVVEPLRLSFWTDTLRLKPNNPKTDMMLQIARFKLKVKLLNKSNLVMEL